jgi:hypothetical protein
MTKPLEGTTISGLGVAIDTLDRSNPTAFAAGLRSALTRFKDDRLN